MWKEVEVEVELVIEMLEEVELKVEQMCWCLKLFGHQVRSW